MGKTTKAENRKKAKSPKGSASQELLEPAALSVPFDFEGPYPYEDRMKRKLYEQTLEQLQIELIHVQKWVKEERKKVVIIFEGRDAAGKGGTIKRFTEHLNPRGARVVALPAPTETERGQWYFQRYISQLPTSGEIVFFDRSWYNRAGVEPVMGFCTPDDYQRFIHQVSHFEQALIESGIHLFKLWFDVSRKEQRQRIESRKDDPLKQWKLSPMDYESMKRWSQYTKARDALFLFTHSNLAPWTIIRSDDKRRARIGAILAVLHGLPYPVKDPAVVVPPDPQIVGCPGDLTNLQGRFMFAEPE
jgi:polyphosphate kinase